MEGGVEPRLVLVGMGAHEIDDLSVIVRGLPRIATGLVDHPQSIVAVVDVREAREEIAGCLFGFVEPAVVDQVDDRLCAGPQ